VIQSNTTLILTLSLLIWGSPYIAKLARIPTPPLEIILGSIFAYLGFITHNEYFNTIAEMGFLYLMFLAGMEVDLKQIKTSSKEVIEKSIAFLLIMTLLSIFFGFIFHLNAITIVSMPLISIGLLASLSKTYGKDKSWLKLAFIAGILGEILSIIALTILDVASHTGFDMKLFIKGSYLLMFVIAVYIVYRLFHLLFWWFPEIKKVLVPKEDTADQDIRLAMSLFFILITVMLYMELELALGGFIAGIAISTFFKHEKKLEEKMSSIGFGFLIPIFFIHVGASLDLSSLAIKGVVTGALLISTLMLLTRLIAAIILKHISGSKDALLVALALSMPLTLLVAVATIGYEAKWIDILSYYQLILASIFEIIISMVAIKILSKTELKES